MSGSHFGLNPLSYIYDFFMSIFLIFNIFGHNLFGIKNNYFDIGNKKKDDDDDNNNNNISINEDNLNEGLNFLSSSSSSKNFNNHDNDINKSKFVYMKNFFYSLTNLFIFRFINYIFKTFLTCIIIFMRCFDIYKGTYFLSHYKDIYLFILIKLGLNISSLPLFFIFYEKIYYSSPINDYYDIHFFSFGYDEKKTIIKKEGGNNDYDTGFIDSSKKLDIISKYSSSSQELQKFIENDVNKLDIVYFSFLRKKALKDVNKFYNSPIHVYKNIYYLILHNFLIMLEAHDKTLRFYGEDADNKFLFMFFIVILRSFFIPYSSINYKYDFNYDTSNYNKRLFYSNFPCKINKNIEIYHDFWYMFGRFLFLFEMFNFDERSIFFGIIYLLYSNP